jgi:uncharacterized membrane protein
MRAEALSATTSDIDSPSLGALLRALLLLGVVGASIAMFVQVLRTSPLEGFVLGNGLALADRIKLVVSMLVAAAAAAGAGYAYARRRGTERLQRFAHVLAPLGLVGLVPSLCTPAGWHDPVNAALAIAAFVLLAEGALRLSFAASSGAGSFALGLVPPVARRWAPLAAVTAGALAYALYMSIETLWMHGRFQTYGYDLGQYDNVFYSTLHGHPLRCSPFGCYTDWSELAGHADLSTFFFLPFYALHPGAPALLVLQSCALGLGAIPIYRFAARRIPRGYAAVLALAYLLYPPLHGLQFYDFHMQPMASTFVLFVIDFVDTKNYWACAAAFVVAIGCREDVSVGLAILGVFLLLSGYRPKAGTVMFVTASVYFVLIRFVIMPKFGPGWFQNIYKDLMPEGAKNYGGVIATLLSNPAYVFSTLLTADKLRYALQILVPIAFLPLRRSWLAVSLVHGSLLTLLTTEYPPTVDIGFQYSANFIPYIFPAAALALASMNGAHPERRPAALGALVAGTLLCGVFWGAIPPRKAIKGGFVTMAMTRPTAADRQRERDLRELNALVPADASMAVSEQEMPHLSRLNMRTLRDTTNADYFLYGTGSQGAGNGEQLLAAGTAELVAQRPGLKLLRRKDLGPPDPADFAARAHWRVSSVLPGFDYAASGTSQRWSGAGFGTFFHTQQEDSPWIDFDLGSVVTLHRFSITNRVDCCQERAIPLVVETSTDDKTWREVARRAIPFTKWIDAFPPDPVRYVRLRVPHPSMLHLGPVEFR